MPYTKMIQSKNYVLCVLNFPIHLIKLMIDFAAVITIVTADSSISMNRIFPIAIPLPFLYCVPLFALLRAVLASLNTILRIYRYTFRIFGKKKTATKR